VHPPRRPAAPLRQTPPRNPKYRSGSGESRQRSNPSMVAPTGTCAMPHTRCGIGSEHRRRRVGCQRSGTAERVRSVSADAVVPASAQRVGEAGMSETAEVVPPRRVGSRDREFTDFMATNTPGLARAAWFLCGDEHRAEELVQQALMKTYMGWAQARRGDPFAYARRAMVTSRIDTWRRLRRERLTAPAGLPEQAVTTSGDAVALRDVLARALSRLTARQRRVVVLRYFLGMSEQEVADDLGVTVGTVKTTAARALRRLRDLLVLDDVSTSATRGAQGE